MENKTEYPYELHVLERCVPEGALGPVSVREPHFGCGYAEKMHIELSKIQMSMLESILFHISNKTCSDKSDHLNTKVDNASECGSLYFFPIVASHSALIQRSLANE